MFFLLFYTYSLRLSPGGGDFCWLRPAPAGRLAVPPPGHSHRAVLQVQVQQRRRRPVADLKTPSKSERRAAPRMGHLFFFFFFWLFFPFQPFFTFSSSHQLRALHIFWAEPAPAPAASGSIALHERGMGEKAKPAPWPDERCGRGVKGSEEVRLDTVDRRVHVLGDLI